jgi:hypothetical protein
MSLNRSEPNLTATLNEYAAQFLKMPMSRPEEIPQEILAQNAQETEEWLEKAMESSERMTVDPEYRKLRTKKLF